MKYIENGKVFVARVIHIHVFLANFMLVAAMNSCPNSYYWESRCHCIDYEIIKYTQRLTRGIMDRIDIYRYFRIVDIKDLDNDVNRARTKSLLENIEVATSMQRKSIRIL